LTAQPSRGIVIEVQDATAPLVAPNLFVTQTAMWGLGRRGDRAERGCFILPRPAKCRL